MRNTSVQVIMAAFETQEGAEEVYKTLKMIKREKLLTFKDTAMLQYDH
jgi:uncharacterized membrane protein